MVPISCCAGNGLTIFAELRHPGCVMLNLPKYQILNTYQKKKEKRHSELLQTDTVITIKLVIHYKISNSLKLPHSIR